MPRRGAALGRSLAAAADHPLTTFLAVETMRNGGNAIDAAIAAAAVNVVTKPHRTHLGGDAFVLIWNRHDGSALGLNAGGRAPLRASIEKFSAGIPAHGPTASTIPGLVDCWFELHKSMGAVPLTSILKPAITLASEGFPVSARLSGAMSMLAESNAPESEAAKKLFLRGGVPYLEGELLRQPELAETLRAVSSGTRESFYGGPVGASIAEAMAKHGGLIDQEDFATDTAVWQTPIATKYRDSVVYEQALPSQGVILLEALNIVENFPLKEWGPDSVESHHVLIEATRQAFKDARNVAADPVVEKVPLDELLLSKEHAAKLASHIDLNRATSERHAAVPTDTTSFVVADEKMVVSFIQSIFYPWGSQFAIAEAGILMNNRMRGFSIDPKHPNRVAPGKRTIHTLNTFLVVRDGQLIVGGGTPGGDYQVQTNLQTIVQRVDWGQDLQSAIDSPRWVSSGDGAVVLESRFPTEVTAGLRDRGHNVQIGEAWEGTIARSQVIASTDSGWAAASDLRGEGVALAV